MACFVNKQFLDICPSIFNNKVSNKKSRLGCTVLNQAIDIWDVYKCSHRGNFFCRKINFNKCSFKNFIKKKSRSFTTFCIWVLFLDKDTCSIMGAFHLIKIKGKKILLLEVFGPILCSLKTTNTNFNIHQIW